MSEHGSYEVRQVDADELLESLVVNGQPSADLIITDPAYQSLEQHRAKGTTTRLTEAWFPIYPDDRYPRFFQLCWQALRPNSHLYVFCDHVTMRVLVPAGEAAGFKCWKPLVWDKITMGMGYHYRARYEFVLFFEKGKRRLKSLSVPDLLRHQRVSGGYPTEKPVELLERLIHQSVAGPGFDLFGVTRPLVVDPFCGSGASLVAALDAGCNYVGGDISEKAGRLTRARAEVYPRAHRVRRIKRADGEPDYTVEVT
jgi:site-specific DNA-methyltransferase (adenine-specific)